jgi:hypothetical protein
MVKFITDTKSGERTMIEPEADYADSGSSRRTSK